MKLLPVPALSVVLSLALSASLRAELVEKADSIAWVEEGEPVWRYSYSQDDGKPYFHPLRVPEGPELTKLKPDDHAWHYGLWFSWKYINGVNYWEESKETGNAEGDTRWKAPRIERLPDGGVVIRMQIDYVNPNGTVDLAEYRDLMISPVGRNGKYTIDWTSHFTAGPDGAYLDRTPLPNEPDGKLWGGYAGLSVRLAHGADPVAYEAMEGPLDDFVDNRMRPRSQGIAATVFDDERNSGSVAILADPRNIEGKHPWYVINGQPSRFICAAVLVPGPVQLDAGAVWELSYRIVLRPKAWDAEDLEREHFRWLHR